MNYIEVILLEESKDKSYKNFIKKYKANDERWKFFFIGIILAFISLAIFINIVQLYFKGKGSFEMDVSAINYVQSVENDSLSRLFKSITYIGDPYTVIIITLIITAILYFKKMKNESVFFGLNILGVAIFNELLKRSFRRDRPTIRIIEASGYSFPSGHSMTFLAFAIILSYLILIYSKNKFKAYFVSSCLVILAIAIGFSRVYLRVHYLSDVLAGWSAAMFWAGINIAIHRYSYYKKITM
ncbi:phosphatase PAP2 family protein [Clostridium tetani]|uniref:Phosphatase n=1 Tax=Clostridium tetani (strain Massachusetts / E88) TaxID=212717 RepID=Q896V3_CLOTE|nr:phosphatase PAP2 family protein [Clostridium tetani]AAO35487.1 phosphatase [Clostridium tetani E88]